MSGPISNVLRDLKRSLASRQTDAGLSIPCPQGLTYRPFQRGAVDYVWNTWKEGRPGVLLADEMGLGKTVEAIGFLNKLHEDHPNDPKRVLIICPASLKLNWEYELTRWITYNPTMGIVSGRDSWKDWDITIINYDIIKSHKAAIQETNWDIMILDECHYCKNPKALRTKLLFGGLEKRKGGDNTPLDHIPVDLHPFLAGKGVKQRAWLPVLRKFLICISGTPIENRPREYWTIIRELAQGMANPNLTNQWRFFARYCGAKPGYNGSIDAQGSSNEAELQRICRENFMVRRLKSEVLQELPAKQRQIITLPAPEDVRRRLDLQLQKWVLHEDAITDMEARAEKAKVTGSDAEFEEIALDLDAEIKIAFDAMSTIRRETALFMAPLAVEHLGGVLRSGIQKVVVFAHHRTVLERFYEELGEFAPVLIYGGISEKQRHEAVARFQNDPKCRVFVGGIKAAGVGLTLTAASYCLMAESDWVPGVVSQAEDRLHRIGQADPVLIQHLVFERSILALMIRRVVQKQEVLNRVLNHSTEAERIAPGKKRKRPVNQVYWENLGNDLSPMQIEVIHKTLRKIAQGDRDEASVANGVGFSRVHSELGRALAEQAFLSPDAAASGRAILRRHRPQVRPRDWDLLARHDN